MARSKEEGLLDFFLSARRTLVREWLREVSISEIRKIAEERFEKRKHFPSLYLGDCIEKKQVLRVPEALFDSEFAAPLGRSVGLAHLPLEPKATALFLPPEQGIFSFAQNASDGKINDWREFLESLPASSICIRTGFLTTEFDVLETAALGFHGLCVHARMLDVYEIQLLTEICRDFRMTLVAIADSPQAVARVLESDCPYIGLWGYDSQTFEPLLGSLSRLTPKIPSSCYRVAFLPSNPEPQWDILSNLKVDACIS